MAEIKSSLKKGVDENVSKKIKNVTLWERLKENYHYLLAVFVILIVIFIKPPKNHTTTQEKDSLNKWMSEQQLNVVQSYCMSTFCRVFYKTNDGEIKYVSLKCNDVTCNLIIEELIQNP